MTWRTPQARGRTSIERTVEELSRLDADDWQWLRDEALPELVQRTGEQVQRGMSAEAALYSTAGTMMFDGDVDRLTRLMRMMERVGPARFADLASAEDRRRRGWQR